MSQGKRQQVPCVLGQAWETYHYATGPTCPRRPPRASRTARGRRATSRKNPYRPPLTARVPFRLCRGGVWICETRVARQNDGGPCGGWKNWWRRIDGTLWALWPPSRAPRSGYAAAAPRSGRGGSSVRGAHAAMQAGARTPAFVPRTSCCPAATHEHGVVIGWGRGVWPCRHGAVGAQIRVATLHALPSAPSPPLQALTQPLSTLIGY
eukprot:1752000-Prymnesium_polylepis.2